MSRKTSGDSVKKLLLFEEVWQPVPMKIGKFSNFSHNHVAFPSEADAALTFLFTRFVKTTSKIRLMTIESVFVFVTYLVPYEILSLAGRNDWRNQVPPPHCFRCTASAVLPDAPIGTGSPQRRRNLCLDNFPSCQATLYTQIKILKKQENNEYSMMNYQCRNKKNTSNWS